MALFIRSGSFIGKTVLKTCMLEAGKREIHRYVRPTMLAIIKRQGKEKPLPIEKTKRSNYIEWNFNAEIYAFGKRLGEDFNIEKLLQAFIHRSYIVQEELKQEEVGIDKPSLSLKDNTKMIEEGNKIISDETRRFLCQSYPRLPLEGINAIHSYVMSEETLSNISKHLGTTDIILSSDYPVEAITLANTLKAVVSALAESQSLERANTFVREVILPILAEKDIDEIYEIRDPLSVLSEILKRDGRGEPEPRIIGQSAMNEILAAYTVGIYSNKQLIGQAPGETIDTAVEMAAKDALKRLFGIHESAKPLNFKTVEYDTIEQPLRISSWKSSAFTQLQS